MPYTATDVQSVGEAGTVISADALPSGVGNGLVFTNDGRTFLQLENTGTLSATVTVVTGATVRGKEVEDQSIVLTSEQIKLAGPFPPELYNQQSGAHRGKVLLEVSGAGSEDVEVAAFN